MTQLLHNLSKVIDLFFLLGLKRFNKAWQVFFEVFITFDRIYKLRLCCSAKEKLRFVFDVTLQQWTLLRCLPHELLEGLDLFFEFLARLSGTVHIKL